MSTAICVYGVFVLGPLVCAWSVPGTLFWGDFCVLAGRAVVMGPTPGKFTQSGRRAELSLLDRRKTNGVCVTFGPRALFIARQENSMVFVAQKLINVLRSVAKTPTQRVRRTR